MSSQNINISPTNVTGKCDLKCSYMFKYNESNSTATNNGISINLTYDSISVPQVLYNTAKYNVSTIMIVSPSVHLFNGKTAPGEILIEHVPLKGGNNLNVCIPFISSSESSTASSIIADIIQIVSTNAPSEGDSTNLNMSDFNLQNIVPRKPFFAYSVDTTDYIVFGELESIPLSSSTITTLQQIIQPYAISMPSAPLYYNSKGPKSGLQIGDGLYISCQPTGSSDDETAVTYDKNTTSYDFSKIIDSPLFKLIIFAIVGCILFVIVFYGIGAFYNYLSEDSNLMSINKILK